MPIVRSIWRVCRAECTLEGTRRLLEQIELAEGVRAVAINMGKLWYMAERLSESLVLVPPC